MKVFSCAVVADCIKSIKFFIFHGHFNFKEEIGSYTVLEVVNKVDEDTL